MDLIRESIFAQYLTRQGEEKGFEQGIERGLQRGIIATLEIRFDVSSLKSSGCAYCEDRRRGSSRTVAPRGGTGAQSRHVQSVVG